MVEEKTVTFWESSDVPTVLLYNPDNTGDDGITVCIPPLPSCGD